MSDNDDTPELDAELKLGQQLAQELVAHLRRMGPNAASVMIPVEVDGVAYKVRAWRVVEVDTQKTESDFNDLHREGKRVVEVIRKWCAALDDDKAEGRAAASAIMGWCSTLEATFNRIKELSDELERAA